MQHQLKTVTAGCNSKKCVVHGKTREDLSLAVLAWAMGLDLLGALGREPACGHGFVLWGVQSMASCQALFVNADKVGQWAGRE